MIPPQNGIIGFMRIEITEKCGIVGVYSENGNAPVLARRALLSLQHRGQEAAGIAIFTPNQCIERRIGHGLIIHALPEEVVDNLGKAKTASAHNRYSTTEGKQIDNYNIQPIHLRFAGLEIAVTHNGNLFNINSLLDVVERDVKNPSDSRLLGLRLLDQRKKHSSWLETFRETLPEITNYGSASLVAVTNDGDLFGIKDIRSIRPLCLGELPDGWILASETVALDMVNANFVRELVSGEIVRIDKHGEISSSFYGEPKAPKPCIFEGAVYLARPDSFMNGKRNRTTRENAGKLLAQRIRNKGINPDVVVPVLDSGLPAAMGTSRELNKPLEIAVTTDHYIGRTFICPGQDSRLNAVSGKHNFTPEGITGKEVVFVDDSGVRLNTSPRINAGLREVGAKKTHDGFASPPVVDNCDLGIDTPTKKELPASTWKNLPLSEIEKNVATIVGADTVTYLPIEDLAKAAGMKPDDFCCHCFGGPHPVREERITFRQKERRIQGKPRITVFISGNGTNLQEIIDRVERKEIDAKIISVVSNETDAYGLTRARKHNINTETIPSKGYLKDVTKRKAYEQRLIEYLEKSQPDIIVLAGWMVILGNKILEKCQELEIPVINLHPALLTRDNESEINTSRGKIPVIRGTHAIKDAFDQNLPVSGVTVHQLLPGTNFDTGPIILQEEVRRKKDETLDEWERRIHQAEYRVLPTALSRVINVIKHNIDISKGGFPW